MFRNRCVRLEEQSAEMIRAQLLAANEELTPEELAAVQHFVDQIGGIENARLAVELLEQLDRAA